MNLPQAKILLEKIITLYKTMSNDEKNISPIERDLMLSYIRQLYESFIEASQNNAPTQAAKVVQQAPTPPPPPKAEVPRPQPQPIVEEKPKPVYEAPKPVYEAPKPPVVEQPRVVTPPPPPPPPPPPVQPTYQQPVYTAPSNITSNVSSDILALFDDKSGRELSDKLSNMPIPDLTKAFGFNDRLLTQNELFGGNKTVFDEILKDLNNMSSYESAKGSLMSLASKYNWAGTDDRKKQAQVFIKLVRRRFN